MFYLIILEKLDLTSIMLSHLWFCMVSLRLNILKIQWVFALMLVMSFKKKLSLTLFMLFEACCNLSGYSKYPWEALLKISSRSKSESLSRLHLSSNSIHGLLKDRDVLDEAGVRLLNVSQGSFTESFIKIQHQEGCQDYTYPPSLILESWKTGVFLMEVKIVSR